MANKLLFYGLLLVVITVPGCFADVPNNQSAANDAQDYAANSPVRPKASANANPTPAPSGLKDSRLQSEADSFLPLFDKMPSVPVYIKDEPILKKGSETQRGVAYTTCEEKSPVIYLKKAFVDKKNQKQIANIVKHEMVHAWFCRRGIKTGHDETFRKKFKSVGGFGN